MKTYAAAMTEIASKTVATFDGIDFRGERVDGAAIVRMDDGATFTAKRTDEARVDSGFAGCDWRLGLRFHELAVNLRVTGRTIQFRNNGDAGWVRCEITFVGDCEADTTARGWLRVW